MTGYSFHPQAESELLDAARYYEARSTGLGHAFIAAVRRGIEQIQASPDSSPVVRRGLRRKPLRRFPYSLIYIYEAKLGEVKIIAVMHQKRRPSYWKGRK